MQLNMLFHLRWAVSLLLAMIFTHSVSALTVDFSVTPNSGSAPLSVTIDAGLSVPSPGAVFISYQWQVSGPENIQLPGWSVQSLDLNKVGQYTITLTITETSGAVGTKSKTVTVSGARPTTPATPTTPTTDPPISTPSQPDDNPTTPTQPVALSVDFSVTPSSGQAPLSITIDAGLSVPSTGAVFRSYEWQVSGPENRQLPGWSVQSLELNKVGEYTITLTITETSGNVGSKSKTVTVSSDGSGVITPTTPTTPTTDPEPPISTPNQPEDNPTTPTQPASALNVDFSITPSGGPAPLSITIDASLSVPSTGTVFRSYEWQVSGPENLEIPGWSVQSLDLEQVGEYTITLTITDTLGAKGTKSKTVTVSASTFTSSKGGEFKGGVKIDEEYLSNDSTFSSQTPVEIITEITADPQFGLGPVNVYVVAQYTLADAENTLFFMEEGEMGNFISWDGNVTLLRPYQEDVSFENGTLSIPIFSGPLTNLLGKYKIYVGYDWSDLSLDMGRAVYTIEPISFEVVP